MRCADLERYLEDYLDGRLTRSRCAMLRRHVASCGACHARVERLRQFERDTRRRCRALAETASVWEGLELDLVGSHGGSSATGLFAAPRMLAAAPGRALRSGRERRRTNADAWSTQRPVGSGAATRLAGALLIALALGAVYQLVRGIGDVEDSAAAWAYLDYHRDRAVPELRSDDPGKVGAWLAAEFGRPTPLPPAPEGFRLAGAGHATLAGVRTAALLYAGEAASEPATVMVFVHAEGASGITEVAPHDASRAALHEHRWHADGLLYTAVGPIPLPELREFAP